MLQSSYLLYKEEILSVQPYVSVFYEVIHQREIDHIIDKVKGKVGVALVAVTGRLNYSVAFYDISLILCSIAALYRQ